MSSLQLVFGSVPQIYISNVMWLQVRQDIGGWKHQRIWCNDWECHIILHIAKGRVIQSYSISSYSAGFSISTLSSTSSNSCHERRPNPMTLLNTFFTNLIILSNCPPHQGGATKIELPDNFILGKELAKLLNSHSLPQPPSCTNKCRTIVRVNFVWSPLSCNKLL